jgi:hypothetical protein
VEAGVVFDEPDEQALENTSRTKNAIKIVANLAFIISP